jgi:carbon-monoxide dehydrogenase large subunit
MVYLGVVRSPYAHARITNVDVTPALAHADVVGAWSGADIAEEWQGSLPVRVASDGGHNAPEHKPVASTRCVCR